MTLSQSHDYSTRTVIKACVNIIIETTVTVYNLVSIYNSEWIMAVVICCYPI